MQVNFYQIVLWLCFACVYIRLLIPYIVFFARYMFNEPVGWDKYIERPRLVFYGIGLLLMHGSYTSLLKYSDNPKSFFFLANVFIFFGGILLSQITWSERFKNVFIPKIKEKLKKQDNFNISITKNQLQKLYNGFVQYDMIHSEQTNLDDFIDVFLKDWHTHNSKIFFKLDAPSCREFYELFKLNFPTNSLSLIDFFKRSDTIRRKDGKPYKYSTIKDAKSRTPVSNRSEELKTIFENL